jgi:hypothetical protein
MLAGFAKGIVKAERSGSGRPILRIEAPLAGYSEEATVALLTFVYSPGSVSGTTLVKAAAADKSWSVVEEVVKLADHLDAPKFLKALEGILLDCLPADFTLTTSWLPLLVLADTWQLQLPRLYKGSLITAARAAVASLDKSASSRQASAELLGQPTEQAAQQRDTPHYPGVLCCGCPLGRAAAYQLARGSVWEVE